MYHELRIMNQELGFKICKCPFMKGGQADLIIQTDTSLILTHKSNNNVYDLYLVIFLFMLHNSNRA